MLGRQIGGKRKDPRNRLDWMLTSSPPNQSVEEKEAGQRQQLRTLPSHSTNSLWRGSRHPLVLFATTSLEMQQPLRTMWLAISMINILDILISRSTVCKCNLDRHLSTSPGTWIDTVSRCSTYILDSWAGFSRERWRHLAICLRIAYRSSNVYLFWIFISIHLAIRICPSHLPIRDVSETFSSRSWAHVATCAEFLRPFYARFVIVPAHRGTGFRPTKSNGLCGLSVVCMLCGLCGRLCP